MGYHLLKKRGRSRPKRSPNGSRTLLKTAKREYPSLGAWDRILGVINV